MPERIGWDKYEVSLLIDACEHVIHNAVPKSQMVKELSAALRNRALKNDVKIDEVFRNQNGIALQMNKMDYLLTGGNKGLPGGSTLYCEMAELKKNNLAAFETILSEAKAQINVETAHDKAIIKKYVDKSLLKAGLTVPKDVTRDLCDALGVALEKGENCNISILLGGETYEAKLTNVNFSEKYADVVTFQIRYSAGSPICRKLNEVFSYTADLIAQNKRVENLEYTEMYVRSPKTIEFICYPAKPNKQMRVETNKMDETKNEFIAWLNMQPKLKYTVSTVVSVQSECSEYATAHKVSSKSFWKIIDAKEYDIVARKLIDTRLFRILHRKTALVFDKSYVYYREFLASINNVPEFENKTEFPENVETTCFEVTGEPIVAKANSNIEMGFGEWMRKKSMAEATVRNYLSSLHSAEIFAKEHGMEGIRLTNDCGVTLTSIERLLADKEFIQFNQKQHNRFSAAFRKLRDYITESERRDAQCTSDVELEIKFPSLYRKLYSISKIYDDPQGITVDHILNIVGGIAKNEEVVEFLDRVSWATITADGVYSFSPNATPRVAEEPAAKIQDEALTDFDKDEFIRVLMTRYQSGMQFDSIDLENFRDTYSNLFDKELTFSDEELVRRLKYCGIFYKDRLFPAEGIIDNTTRDKLFAYIENSFAAGNKVLYYKSIYSDMSDAFTYCFSLTDEKMLQAFIEFTADNGRFYFYSNYMSTEKGIKIDPSREIADFMLAAGKPLSYEEVYSGLSHISNDVIYREIQVNPCFLRNEKEHYFHIDIFEFSADDADRISTLISKEIDENGYAIWSRVFAEIQEQMPIFLENNLYLSSLGIRNALSYYMNDRFNFEGEVISSHDKSLNMADVFSLYGKHHAPFSYDDICAFSREIGSIIYFDALAEETVRVSRELFVSKENVNFDAEAVDAALETYLSSGYILVKDVDSFLVFPNVGYEWNEFLLESYLHNYSKKFALINNGSSLNNVAGAVVKKNGEYTQFVDVCAHALAESGIELKKGPALNYLAETNLITRRSYKELDIAMIRARQIRNRKE